MPMTSKRAALRAACIALAWTFVSTASAQEYPNRTIRVIMPLGPGGIGDVYLRALAQSLQKRLGQPVVVENKPGAATTIAHPVAGRGRGGLTRDAEFTLVELASPV
jgi:tripartite-type tricarboxylate transporter receptor subunit TctC